jgi:hypothetical protein
MVLCLLWWYIISFGFHKLMIVSKFLFTLVIDFFILRKFFKEIELYIYIWCLCMWIMMCVVKIYLYIFKLTTVIRLQNEYTIYITLKIYIFCGPESVWTREIQNGIYSIYTNFKRSLCSWRSMKGRTDCNVIVCVLRRQMRIDKVAHTQQNSELTENFI